MSEASSGHMHSKGRTHGPLGPQGYAALFGSPFWGGVVLNLEAPEQIETMSLKARNCCHSIFLLCSCLPPFSKAGAVWALSLSFRSRRLSRIQGSGGVPSSLSTDCTWWEGLVSPRVALSFLGQTHLCGYHCRIENRPRETFPPTHHPNPIGLLDSQITSPGTQPRHFQHSRRGQLLHLGRFLRSVQHESHSAPCSTRQDL